MTNRFKKAINQRINEVGSQVDLASKSGVKQGAIANYLSGKTDLSNAKLQTLTKLFPEFEYYLFDDEKAKAEVNLSEIEREIVYNLKQLSSKSQLEVLTVVVSKLTAEQSDDASQKITA